MNRKIICLGMLSIFLLTGFSSISNAGSGNPKISTLNSNQPPRMQEATAIWSIVYNKNGMAAPFSASAYDPDDDECRLVVTICKKGTTNEITRKSDYGTDYHKKRVSIPIDPTTSPIGTYYTYDMYIEDTHGAESYHDTGEFYIKRSNPKTKQPFQLIFERHTFLFSLLRFLQNLQELK